MTFDRITCQRGPITQAPYTPGFGSKIRTGAAFNHRYKKAKLPY